MAISFNQPGEFDVDVVTTPAAYTVDYYVPGVVGKGAAGLPYVRAHTEDGLREFNLTWEAILGAYVPILEEVFSWLCSGEVEFTDPNGDEWTVVRHPSQQKITFRRVLARADSNYWRFSTSLQMIESP